jgi:DNA primase
MAGKIPQAFIDDLLSQTNIVTLVRERITLKKAGSDYHACCPFHDEKTPSFTVSERKQFFYCFGCGASGNAVKFIMDYDRLDFITALESLANQAGMTIPRDDRQDQNYAVYYRLMQHCQNHYRTQLQRPPAQQFLNQRQISVAIAETFQIGFAADAWRQCLESANQQKFSTQQCLDVGLVTHGENKARNRPYDRFRARVMFPIRDERGRTIAFGGRAMGDHKPKYLNSPESKIFHKRKVLYGLYEAKQAHKKLTELIVVEGYMDVVALACHGVQNAVATLGTAITEQHLSNLFKHCQRVTFCFDGDNAGRKAAWRACETSLSMMHDGREVRFLFLPEKEDPDSLINQQGREAFMALLDHAEPLADFFFEACLKTHPVDTLAGRAGLAKTVQSYLAKLPTGIYKNLMQQKCSSLVQLPVEQMASPSPMPQPPHSDNPQVKTEPNNQEPSPKPTRATLKAIYLLLNHSSANCL